MKCDFMRNELRQLTELSFAGSWFQRPWILHSYRVNVHRGWEAEALNPDECSDGSMPIEREVHMAYIQGCSYVIQMCGVEVAEALNPDGGSAGSNQAC